MKPSRLRMAYRRIRAGVYRAQAALYTKIFSNDKGVLESAQDQLKPGYLIAIYRARNAPFMERLVLDAETVGLRVGLWALDAFVPSLRRVSLGVGPGSRTDLLTQLDQRMRESAREFVLVADDDFEFVHGTVASFVRLAVQCNFMLSQPSHIPSSKCSYGFNTCRPWLTARATTFVECGPIFLVHPNFYSRTFPIPANFGMGWGLELHWLKSLLPSEHFGIVDSVWIFHHGAVGAEYQSLQSEVDRLGASLRGLDLTDIKRICRTTSVWWRNRPLPKAWATDPCLSVQVVD